MKRLFIFPILALTLVGCTAQSSTVEGDPPEVLVEDGVDLPPVYRVQIDGKPCLVIHHQSGGYHDQTESWSIDCDWSPQ